MQSLTIHLLQPDRLQEKDEYVENIIADMKRLGLPCDAITYTSDYFPQLKECGERLIKAGEGWALVGTRLHLFTRFDSHPLTPLQMAPFNFSSNGLHSFAAAPCRPHVRG